MYANTQSETAGLVILHQQCVWVVTSSLVFRATDVSASLPSRLLQTPIPNIGTDGPLLVLQVADQFVVPVKPELFEHVAYLSNATHLVTAVAGGIDAAQIMPAIIKCFLIFLSPFSFVE